MKIKQTTIVIVAALIALCVLIAASVWLVSRCTSIYDACIVLADFAAVSVLANFGLGLIKALINEINNLQS